MTNITTNDAMRKYGVSRVQIYNWAKLGKITKIQSGVYSEESIQKYISEHNVRTNARKPDAIKTTIETPMDALLIELGKLDNKELPEQWKAEIALKCADFYFSKPKTDYIQPEKDGPIMSIGHSDTYVNCLKEMIEHLRQQVKEKPAEIVKEVPRVPEEVEEKLLDLQMLAENQAKEIEALEKKLAKQAKPAEIERLKANLSSKDNEIARLNEIIKDYQTEAYNAASHKEQAVMEKLSKGADSDCPAKK